MKDYKELEKALKVLKLGDSSFAGQLYNRV